VWNSDAPLCHLNCWEEAARQVSHPHAKNGQLDLAFHLYLQYFSRKREIFGCFLSVDCPSSEGVSSSVTHFKRVMSAPPNHKAQAHTLSPLTPIKFLFSFALSLGSFNGLFEERKRSIKLFFTGSTAEVQEEGFGWCWDEIRRRMPPETTLFPGQLTMKFSVVRFVW
jgi:hypothetical protein